MIGMLLAADGLAFLVNPRGQLRVWSGPGVPRWMQRTVSWCAGHPGACRAIATAELAAGIALLRSAPAVAAAPRRLAGVTA